MLDQSRNPPCLENKLTLEARLDIPSNNTSRKRSYLLELQSLKLHMEAQLSTQTGEFYSYRGKEITRQTLYEGKVKARFFFILGGEERGKILAEPDRSTDIPKFAIPGTDTPKFAILKVILCAKLR